MNNLANRLPDLQPPMSLASFEAMRANNREKFVSSGYIEQGRQLEDRPLGPGGMWFPTLSNQMRFGRGNNDADGQSGSDNPIYMVDGIIIHVLGNRWGSLDNNLVPLPEAPIANVETSTSTSKEYVQGEYVVKDNDVYVTVSYNPAPAQTPLTDTTYFEKVEGCTHEDLVGLEVFLVELGEGDNRVPAVYPYGNVQHGPTGYTGIRNRNEVLALSPNIMPDEYTSSYPGEHHRESYGARWDELSPEEREVFYTDPRNNIFFKDGRAFQWQYRHRVISSKGLGFNRAYPYFNLPDAIGDHFTYIKPQGKLTSKLPQYARPEEDVDFNYLLTNGHFDFPKDTSFGIAATNPIYAPNSAITEGDTMFFMSICRMRRRNRGAYHPILNPFGTAGFSRLDTAGAGSWLSNNVQAAVTVADCFAITSTAMSPGVWHNSGNLDSGYSGNPQGLYHDVVKQDNVEDLRIPANGISNNPDEHFLNLTMLRQRPWEDILKMRVTEATIVEARANGDILPSVSLNQANETHVRGIQVYNKTKNESIKGVYYILTNTNEEVIKALPESADYHMYEWQYVPNAFEPDRVATWEAGDELVIVDYLHTKVGDAEIPVMDIIAEPDSLVSLYQNFGSNPIMAARWLPVDLVGNDPTVEASRLVENNYSVQCIVSTDYESFTNSTVGNTTYIPAFLSSNNAATITNGSGNLLALLYSTPSLLFNIIRAPFPPASEYSDRVWHLMNRESEKGGMVIKNLIGKIPTENSNREFLSYLLEEAPYNRISYGLSSFPTIELERPIRHQEVLYNAVGPSVKVLPYIAREDVENSIGLAWMGVLYKEMAYNFFDDNAIEVDLSDTTPRTVSKGQHIRFINSNNPILEKYTLNVLDDLDLPLISSDLSNYEINYDDYKIYASNGYAPVLELVQPSAKGDDGQFTTTSRTRFSYITDKLGNKIIEGYAYHTRPLGFINKTGR